MGRSNARSSNYTAEFLRVRVTEVEETVDFSYVLCIYILAVAQQSAVLISVSYSDVFNSHSETLPADMENCV